jgi:uncharacterized protein (TIGR02466 family)
MIERLNLSDSPLWIINYDRFLTHKEKFLSSVYEIKKLNHQGVKISNLNGYQSDKIDLSNEQYKEFNPLWNFIIDVISNRILSEDGLITCGLNLSAAWININDNRSAINIPHSHDGVYSGVFYLKTPPRSGKIVFHDTSSCSLWEGLKFRNHKQFGPSTFKMFDVQEGFLFIWRSYQMHYVLANDHDDERISIAFNINCN